VTENAESGNQVSPKPGENSEMSEFWRKHLLISHKLLDSSLLWDAAREWPNQTVGHTLKDCPRYFPDRVLENPRDQDPGVPDLFVVQLFGTFSRFNMQYHSELPTGNYNDIEMPVRFFKYFVKSM